MTGMGRRGLLVAGIVIAAVARSDAAKPDRAGDDRALRSLIASDTALLGDLGEAAAVFERRLEERVSAKDGLILVTDVPELATIEAFPATIPWSISCGRYFGLSVSFGSGTSNDSGVIDVELSKASLTDVRCRELLPMLGRKIETLLR